MKKLFCSFFCFLIVILTLFSTGCGNGVYYPPNNTIELPHCNNVISNEDGKLDLNASYDSSLYSMLERNVFGADESVVFVSKEQATTSANKLANKKGLDGEEKTKFVNDYIKEYSDYFFLYVSSCAGWQSDKKVFNPEDESTASVVCLKSRDLSDWKLCGALYDGFSLYLDKNTWVTTTLWAAEVVYNPDDCLFYMYFASMTKSNDGTIPGADYSNFSFWTSRFSAGVAYSETPNGPFIMATSDNYYNGASNLNGEMLNIENPNIDVQKGLGRGRKYPVIDLHPAFVDDGNSDTFDLYLYFVRHGSNELGYKGNTIWGMKMKDMVTPDYSSLRKLISPWFDQKVEYIGGNPEEDLNYKITEFDKELQTPENDAGGCAEAPTLYTREVKGKLKYYLSYSPRGVGWLDYDIYLAVADNPLGPYTRLSANTNGIMMSYARNTDLVSVGHGGYVKAGDQTFCTYGIMTNDYGTEGKSGRYDAFNELTWYYNNELGYELPIVNGPFKSLQPKPNVATGYRNIAKDAKIKAVNFNENTIKYLTDGLISSQEFTMDMETITTNVNASVSFVFDNPVTLRSVAVYNSLEYDYAFDKVSFITFELAEEKQFGNEKTKTVAIKDLVFDKINYDKDFLCIYQGGASIATFDEIKVNKVTFTFNSKIDNEATANSIKISEIFLMGK